MVQAFRRSALWLVTSIALLLPRAAAAQTFTLTINLVNNSTVNKVNVMDGATGTVLAQCSTSSAAFSCPITVNSGAQIRLAATATGAANSAVPARFSVGSGPAAACALSSCAFTMTAAAAVTATFIADGSPMSTVTTTIAGDALGRVVVSGDPCNRTSLSGSQICTSSYLTGSTVWLDAEARPATRFAGYSAGAGPAAVCGTALECEMTLSAAATVTATFVAMTSFSVTPPSAIGSVGGAQTVYQAIGTYSDAVTEPIAAGAGEWHASTAPRFNDTGFHYTISGLGPGAYVLGVYARSTVTETFSIVKTIHFTVNATALMAFNPPAAEAVITSPSFIVGGWSIDRAVESTAQSGPGVETLHVYAYPNPGSGQPPIFLGVAGYGYSRPDVAALYGSRYDASGFYMTVVPAHYPLAPGVYDIAVHSYSTVSGFNAVAVVRVTLQ